jgi:uncharacterized membrane protein (DUF4010 family)
MNHIKRWRLLVGLVILLFLIEYSPLVIPQGQYKPILFGFPYSLWLGILFAILVVFLTYIGSKIYLKVIGEEIEK